VAVPFLAAAWEITRTLYIDTGPPGAAGDERI